MATQNPTTQNLTWVVTLRNCMTEFISNCTFELVKRGLWKEIICSPCQSALGQTDGDWGVEQSSSVMFFFFFLWKGSVGEALSCEQGAANDFLCWVYVLVELSSLLPSSWHTTVWCSMSVCSPSCRNRRPPTPCMETSKCSQEAQTWCGGFVVFSDILFAQHRGVICKCN